MKSVDAKDIDHDPFAAISGWPLFWPYSQRYVEAVACNLQVAVWVEVVLASARDVVVSVFSRNRISHRWPESAS